MRKINYTLALITISFALVGCDRVTPADAERHMSSVLLAVQNRDVAQLDSLLAAGSGDLLKQACTSPALIRSFRVLPVSTPSHAKDSIWKMSYEATISDYPSAVFNSMALPQLLGEPQRLRPYEETTVLSGALLLKREKKAWVLVEAPAAHDPLGIALRFARICQKDGLAPSTNGSSTGGLGAVFPLLNETEEPNHLGTLTREDVLTRLGRKLQRAEEQGLPSVLQQRYLPPDGRGASQALNAVGALDTFLIAWWRGAPEEKVGFLEAGGFPGASSMRTAFGASPVRLRAYNVRGISRESQDRIVVNVDLTVTDVPSSFAGILLAADLDEPRTQVSLVDEGIKMSESLILTRTGESWHADFDPNSGVLGYAYTMGEQLLRNKGSRLPPVSEKDRFIVDISLKLALLYSRLQNLNFKPVREIISLGSSRSKTASDHLAAIFKRVITLSNESASLRSLPREALAFSLGTSLSFAVFAAEIRRSAGQDALNEMRDTGVKLARALELSPIDQDLIKRRFSASSDADDSNVLFRVPDDISGIGLSLSRRYGSRLSFVFTAGIELGRAALINSPGDSDQAKILVTSLALLKAQLAVTLAEAKPESIAQLEKWAARRQALTQDEESRLVNATYWFDLGLDGAPATTTARRSSTTGAESRGTTNTPPPNPVTRTLPSSSGGLGSTHKETTVGNDSRSATTSGSKAASSTQLLTAKKVPGKPGFVFSPYDIKAPYVDVSGIPAGAKALCPYTGKMFLVP